MRGQAPVVGTESVRCAGFFGLGAPALSALTEHLPFGGRRRHDDPGLRDVFTALAIAVIVGWQALKPTRKIAVALPRPR